jgi:HD-like signal output (HDOD) protein
MKKRVLFVDDEPLVLQGLQRLLRPMRQEWDMEFAESGAQALDCLRATPCDVVVSDMMMPGMNGAELLEKVREASPNTVRLVLSGHTEKQLALRCVGVAHQFLSKPCDAQHLRATISRVTGLGFEGQNERLIKLVGELERLPSLPSIYLQLEALLDDPFSSTHQIGLLISRDMALTAHLLKIVNSAFFGLAQRVSQPAEAVTYLGFDTLKSVVLAAGVFDQCRVDPASGLSMEAAAEHSQNVAATARLIAEWEGAPQAIVEECFTAGMLHDVGTLVLACNLPQSFAGLRSLEPGARFGGETEVFGANHAEVGGYLLGLWGLPNGVVETTRLHHTPGASESRGFGSLVAVHVADHFVHRAAKGDPSAPLDEAWLAALGLTDRLPAWEAAAAKFLS